MGIYGVEDYLDRAKQYLAVSDENSLRHACLEIRLAIESIVYQKLAQIGETLPPKIIRTWQPPTAISMLVRFEQGADKDKTLSLGLGPDGQPIATSDYRMFSKQWLKAYHKLGSYLHSRALLDVGKSIDRDAITQILQEVERVASADMIISVNRINTFECAACGGNMYASQEQIDAADLVECPNQNCGNKHLVRPLPNDQYLIEPSNLFMFACQDCGNRIAVDYETVKDRKACWNCAAEYVFTWGVGRAKPAESKKEE